VLRVLEERQIVCIVWEVKREVLVSLFPDIADLVATLDDKAVQIDCFATSGESESAGDSQYLPRARGMDDLLLSATND
jgi:hypothetical protein